MAVHGIVNRRYTTRMANERRRYTLHNAHPVTATFSLRGEFSE